MVITKRAPAFLSHVSVSGCDGRIILGYATFAMVALVGLVGIYLASGGSGMSEADLAIAAVLP